MSNTNITLHSCKFLHEDTVDDSKILLTKKSSPLDISFLIQQRVKNLFILDKVLISLLSCQILITSLVNYTKWISSSFVVSFSFPV